VQPQVARAPGAEDNPLANWLIGRIEASLAEREDAQRDFYALRAAIAVVAPDKRHQVTLRFDHGYLTVHDGMMGIPDVTLCADEQVLKALADIPLTRFGRLPLPPLRPSRAAVWRKSFLDLLSGELKIYGLFTQGKMVLRLLRLLARR
jgi:hypothetical protein